MKRPVVAALAVVALVLVFGLGWWSTARWREEPADALSIRELTNAALSTSADVDVPMSWSLGPVHSDPAQGPVTVTDVAIDAGDGVTLAGVGWMDSSGSKMAFAESRFPPRSIFARYPGAADHFRTGLPAGPLPRGSQTWSLVLGLTVDRVQDVPIRAVRVTYEVDGREQEQTFLLQHTLCGRTPATKDRECSPILDKTP
ncbi:hypothetical protein M3697_08425 [Janibacter melonis]|uniref:hypothetical protein n=1 Tax=Janibacter melonis TaxID=262209 RepID=UPI0020443F0C|nr:hypothetical protein [Janibacter melonis]MCM3555129.1 hypothetical protein [Janibacter melonis]